jgi:hypothetical protein
MRALDEVALEENIRERLAEELFSKFYVNGSRCRQYHTAGWNGAFMVVNAVSHMVVEAAFQ